MKLVLSREQCKAFDERAMSEANVPGLLLMENAGRGAAELLLAHFEGQKHMILVVAGPGNNGGDGFVVARRLHVTGNKVKVALLVEPSQLTSDARAMWDAYCGIGGNFLVVHSTADFPRFDEALAAADVVVDAIFGTGLTRNVTGLHAQVIERINAAPIMRLALDIPSGLECNRGTVLGAAVRADVTVTFGHAKAGHFTTTGVEYTGQLEVADIGVPAQEREPGLHLAERHERADVSPLFMARSPAAHKGRAGRVGVLAGHPGTTGAALLCASGALRMGAGLVTHLGLADTINAIESRVLEAMTRKLDPHRLTSSLVEAIHGMDALVVGPGMGLGAAQTELVEHIVENSELPVVLDADALTLISGNLRRFRLAKGPRVLLPHLGEMARLLQISTSDVEKDPYSALALLTDLTHAIVVLKGAYSLIGAPGRKVAIVGSPCPSMATGGTGDVLAGITGALLVDHQPFDATLIAVHLHSRAGKLWAENTGSDRGMLASDLVEQLPKAIAELSTPRVVLTD